MLNQVQHASEPTLNIILRLRSIGSFVCTYMTEFLGIEPTLEDYWRSIILYGQNIEEKGASLTNYPKSDLRSGYTREMNFLSAVITPSEKP